MDYNSGTKLPKRRVHTLLAGAIATALTVALATPLVAPLLSAQAATKESTQTLQYGENFADVVESVRSSVVNISTTTDRADSHALSQQQMQPFQEFFKRRFQGQERSVAPATAQGSGFIISADGRLVTNLHVVVDATAITVTLNDGTQLSTRLVGGDPKTDVALLQVETTQPLPFVEFGDSDTVRAGDWVLAIGNPFGLGGSVTAGIVSARGRDIQAGPYDDFIQVDAPINRGNSGGPLFDTEGRVIGINTAIFSPNGGSVGIGFAIPSSLATKVVGQLDRNGVVQRG
jgi:serine protease Do